MKRERKKQFKRIAFQILTHPACIQTFYETSMFKYFPLKKKPLKQFRAHFVWRFEFNIKIKAHLVENRFFFWFIQSNQNKENNNNSFMRES